jgi:hypothetical protein
MKLTSEQKTTALDRLRALASKPSACSVCGQETWSLGDHVFQVSEFDPTIVGIKGSLYPIVPLFCVTCGNTHFLNALLLGVMKPSEGGADDARR